MSLHTPHLIPLLQGEGVIFSSRNTSVATPNSLKNNYPPFESIPKAFFLTPLFFLLTLGEWIQAGYK